MYATTYMDLKGIMQSENRQFQKDNFYDSIYVAFLKWQNYKDEKQSSDRRELRREERGAAITGSRQGSFVSCLVVITHIYMW